MMYVYAIGGFALLFGGGEFLVRGAVSVARRLGLSSLLIGMTVVAACTSAPELVVSVGAALAGSSDIAIGNVVGSNIFNVLGVLGAAALITPIAVKPAAIRRDTLVMLGASVALALLALTGTIGWIPGAALFAGLTAYVVVSYRLELRSQSDPAAELHEREAEEISGPASLAGGVVNLAIGLAALVIGSRLLISGATDIARVLGISEAVIGLTMVALGTSLPELATSVIAAVRRHADVAVGNVIGSNIFNILGIMGVTSMVQPVAVAEQIASLDVWLMLGVAALLVPLLLWRGRIGRLAGAGFLAGYAVYAVALLGGAAHG